MQQIKNLKIGILGALSILGVILGGCDSLIYDNLADCPQGVYVKFYSMTPCETDSTFIGDVSDLSVFAFDDNDKLVIAHHQKNASLTRDFEVLMPVSNGNFSFIAWAGLNDLFLVEEFTPGITTKQDVMMSLKMKDNIAVQIGDNKVWQGESRMYNLPDPAIFGSQFLHATVNLREITNRMKLTVVFDNEQITDKSTDDLKVVLKSASGTLRYDGSPKSDAPIKEYQGRDLKVSADSATWDITILDLVKGFNYDLELTLGYDDEGKEIVVFKNDLILKILSRADDEGGIRLECENDFDVKFVINEYCPDCPSHFSVNIFVNDWQVHSYSTDLGN